MPAEKLHWRSPGLAAQFMNISVAAAERDEIVFE